MFWPAIIVRAWLEQETSGATFTQLEYPASHANAGCVRPSGNSDGSTMADESLTQNRCSFRALETAPVRVWTCSLE
jgi:hypothetical protein